MYLLIDDVCPSNLKYWCFVDEIIAQYPDIYIIAFVIANNKNKELVSKSQEFNNWFLKYKNRVEIGVHGYDHIDPPEQERDNAKLLVKKSLEILRQYLPEHYLYRPPGHQRTIATEGILKELGFSGIAYQTRIKYFNGQFIEPIINAHCCNDYANPITKWKSFL